MDDAIKQPSAGEWRDDRLIFAVHQRPILIINGKAERFREAALIQHGNTDRELREEVTGRVQRLVRGCAFDVEILDYRNLRQNWKIRMPFRWAIRPSGRCIIWFEGWRREPEWDRDAEQQHISGYCWFGTYAGTYMRWSDHA